MEARFVFGSLAVLLAFGGGVGIASAGMARLKRRPIGTVFAGDTTRAGRLAWRLRNGFAWIMPAAKILLRSKRATDLVEEALWAVRARGYAASKESLLTFFLAVVVLAACVVGLLTRSLVCGIALAACLCALVVVWLRAAWDKRREASREAVPDALRSMGVCFQSGLSLLQTLKQVASEAKGPMKALFERSAHQMETGGSVEDALSALRGGSMVPELAFVAVALDVQHQAGGSMKQVLDAARETVEGEMELRRSLRVQTAQAKLSARVVSVMPFALIALFSLISEGFLAPFFSSPWGLALLGLAFGMQAAGIIIVRRMLAVEVD